MKLNLKNILIGSFILFIVILGLVLFKSYPGLSKGILKRDLHSLVDTYSLRANDTKNYRNIDKSITDKILKTTNKVSNVRIPPRDSDRMTINALLAESIPYTWKQNFDEEVEIRFFNNTSYPAGEEPPTVTFTDSEKNMLRNNIYKTIYVASRIEQYFTKALPWTHGKSYYDWVIDSIDTINISSEIGTGSFGGDREITINGPIRLESIRDGDDSIWFNSQSGGGFFSFIAIITHEIRHNNDSGYFHMECDGSIGNDESLRYMGAWGVNVLSIHWMRNYLPPQMKTAAQEISPLTYLRRICTFSYDEWNSAGETGALSDFLSEEDRDWLRRISTLPLEI